MIWFAVTLHSRLWNIINGKLLELRVIIIWELCAVDKDVVNYSKLCEKLRSVHIELAWKEIKLKQ